MSITGRSLMPYQYQRKFQETRDSFSFSILDSCLNCINLEWWLVETLFPADCNFYINKIWFSLRREIIHQRWARVNFLIFLTKSINLHAVEPFRSLLSSLQCLLTEIQTRSIATSLSGLSTSRLSSLSLWYASTTIWMLLINTIKSSLV